MDKNNEFSFEIVKHIEVLSVRDKNGMQMEVNIVSYRGAKPKWDIRKWNEDHTKMSKGITLDQNEFDILMSVYMKDLGELPEIAGQHKVKYDDEMSDSELFGDFGDHDDGLDLWTRNGMD